MQVRSVQARSAHLRLIRSCRSGKVSSGQFGLVGCKGRSVRSWQIWVVRSSQLMSDQVGPFNS